MPALRDSGVRRAYQEAVETLARGLKADRAVLVHVDAHRQLVLGAVHGMPVFHLHDAPISVSLLSEVVKCDRSFVFGNVPNERDARDNLSLDLSGAISLLCVPFYDASGATAGALYADTAQRPDAFHRSQLLFARDCARWLEGCLAGTNFYPRPDPEDEEEEAAPRPARAAVRAAEKPRRARLRPVSDARVSAQGQMVLFRALSTLLGAGVPIHDGLDLLAQNPEEPELGPVVEGLAQAVREGEPLSGAMARYPNVFSVHLRSAVRMGERTGRLVQILALLSNDLEKGRRLTYKVRAALTYPAILSVACVLLLLLGPPFLLEGHLRMLAESGVALPWSTNVLIWLSQVMRQPAFFLALAGGLATLAACLRGPGTRAKLWSYAHRLPVAGKILGQLSLTSLTRSLSLQLRSGLTALEALDHARAGCRDERLKEALRKTEDAVRHGETIARAFALSGHFSSTFLGVLEAGETSGSLPELMGWLAELTERELESSLESFVALAEPLVLGLMGVAATGLLIATLKPTLLLLQNL